ncbi:transposase [Photobacterium phosphoreum]|uniref:transposase n=1 Tax=Photobacterium phosphoreum TaxID=659 RepID=UPI0015E7DA48|nr:transposase [Photobacterium phosphoreum]
MKKARTTYSVAFKHDAANLVLDKGYTIQEACNAVGAGYTAMSRWVAQLKQALLQRSFIVQGKEFQCFYGGIVDDKIPKFTMSVLLKKT